MSVTALREAALDHVIGVEGGYSDDPADSGGRTRYGITEAVARISGYRGPMRQLPRELAETIYGDRYWDAMRLDDVAYLCPLAALELFESGVNCGVATAGRWLQRALNALNDAERRWPDTSEDGAIGPGTLAALDSCVTGSPGADKLLATMLNIQQGAHYIYLTRRREKDERFLRGWLANRVMADLALIARVD